MAGGHHQKKEVGMCRQNVFVLVTLILIGFATAATDILEIQTRWVTVKSMTSDSVTVADGDSVFTICADLLNKMTVEIGDSLALDIAVGPRLGVGAGRIHEVWKIYPGEEWVTGVVITKKDMSGVVEITMDELDSDRPHTFKLAVGSLEMGPGDTLTIVEKFNYLVRRKTPNSSLEVRTDTSRQRYQIADHRPSPKRE
ncbi:MAG: hypothetical protein WAP55_03285 [Minisyncoccia bacterium]